MMIDIMSRIRLRWKANHVRSIALLALVSWNGSPPKRILERGTTMQKKSLCNFGLYFFPRKLLHQVPHICSFKLLLRFSNLWHVENPCDAWECENTQSLRWWHLRRKAFILRLLFLGSSIETSKITWQPPSQ